MSKAHQQRRSRMSSLISVWNFVLCTTFCMPCTNFPFRSKISIKTKSSNPRKYQNLKDKQLKVNPLKYRQKRQASSKSQKQQKNNSIHTPKSRPITKHQKLTITYTNQTTLKQLKHIITNPKQQNLFKDTIRNSPLKRVHKLIW